MSPNSIPYTVELRSQSIKSVVLILYAELMALEVMNVQKDGSSNVQKSYMWAFI